MKHIIKLSDLIGSEIRTRFSLDALKAKLNENDEYLVDLENVNMISRSAADELFIITHQYKVTLVHLSQFVRQMIDVVAVGRFSPRKYDATDATFINCDTMESLRTELQKLSGANQ